MKVAISLSIVSIACATWFAPLPGAFAADTEPGFKNLFNGMDLTGWDGNPKFWSAKDGTITGQTTADNPTKGNTFLIWRDGEVGDFELRLSFKIVGGNSGIQYRSKVTDAANWVVGGYQADFEAGTTYSGIVYEERGRGILAERGQMVWIQPDGKKRVVGAMGKSEDIQAVIKKEDWNDYVILARGNHLTHIINSRVTADVVDDQSDKAAKSGILALQLHAGPPMTVQFKDIRIKKLGSDPTARAANDLQKFQGSWRATDLMINGESVSQDLLEAVEITFTGNSYRSAWSNGSDSGNFSLLEDGQPKSLDIVSEKSGKIPAIYEFIGDTLRVCYAFDGVPRPKAFTAPAESKLLLAVYKKK
ncbi:MAG: DUF1080 domain-containing protein [Verrucomicrobiales bacterium]|nr:DUF1080 domain-containing protein [Verrucomicrobiales bacterium]